MNVLRIIFVVAVVWLAWRLYRSLRDKQIERRQDSSAPDSAADKVATTYEPMARCARCGVHAPAHALSQAGLCGRCGE